MSALSNLTDQIIGASGEGLSSHDLEKFKRNVHNKLKQRNQERYGGALREPDVFAEQLGLPLGEPANPNDGFPEQATEVYSKEGRPMIIPTNLQSNLIDASEDFLPEEIEISDNLTRTIIKTVVCDSNPTTFTVATFELSGAVGGGINLVDMDESFVFLYFNLQKVAVPIAFDTADRIRNLGFLSTIGNIQFPLGGAVQAEGWNNAAALGRIGQVIAENLLHPTLTLPENWRQTPALAWYTGIDLIDLWQPSNPPGLSQTVHNLITGGYPNSWPAGTPGPIPAFIRIPFRLICPINQRLLPADAFSSLSITLDSVIPRRIGNLMLGINMSNKMADVQLSPSLCFCQIQGYALNVELYRMYTAEISSETGMMFWGQGYRVVQQQILANTLVQSCDQLTNFNVQPGTLVIAKVWPLETSINNISQFNWEHNMAFVDAGPVTMIPRIRNMQISSIVNGEDERINFDLPQLAFQTLTNPVNGNIAQTLYIDYDFGEKCMTFYNTNNDIWTVAQLNKSTDRQLLWVQPGTTATNVQFGFSFIIPLNPNLTSFNTTNNILPPLVPTTVKIQMEWSSVTSTNFAQNFQLVFIIVTPQLIVNKKAVYVTQNQIPNAGTQPVVAAPLYQGNTV